MLKLTFTLFLSFSVAFGLQAQWTSISNYPDGNTYSAKAFVIDGIAYVGGGNTSKRSFYSYNPTTDTWKSLGDIPGDVNRSSPITFVINGKGYMGCGGDAGQGSTKTFYEYDPATDTWTQKADFPAGFRHSGCYLSDGTQGYVIGGVAGTEFTSEVWAYNPTTDKWTEKASYPDGNIYWPTGFVIDGVIYAGTGSTDNGNFFAYNTLKDEWEGKTMFPGDTRTGAVGFSYSGRGFIGGGGSVTFTANRTDFYEYDPAEDSWTKKEAMNFPNQGTAWSTAFVIENELYFGLGASVSGGISPTDKFFKTTLEINSSDIDEISNQQQSFSTFPNPSNGQFSISTQNSLIAKSVSITGLDGKIISEHTFQNSVVQISNLPKGIYIAKLHANTGETISQKKVVVH